MSPNKLHPGYVEAKWRVKIAHFTEKHDMHIRGVIHVGSNDGYEVQHYLQMGIEKVLCFEPYPLAVDLFNKNYAKEIEEGKVKLFPFGLGSKEETLELHIAPDTGQGSSFLNLEPEFLKSNPDSDIDRLGLGTVSAQIKRFDEFISKNQDIALSDYNCLVVDVQGMELEVLKGFGVYLGYFFMLNIECSEKPVYIGEAPAQEVIDWLATQGLVQDSPIETHNDIFFIRK